MGGRCRLRLAEGADCSISEIIIDLVVEDRLLIRNMRASLMLISLVVPVRHVWDLRRRCETKLRCTVVSSMDVLVRATITAIADIFFSVSVEVIVIYLNVMLMLLLHHTLAITLVLMGMRLHHQILILGRIVMVMRWGHAFTSDPFNDSLLERFFPCTNGCGCVRLALGKRDWSKRPWY